MEHEPIHTVFPYVNDLSETSGVSASLFDFSVRDFISGTRMDFCAGCPLCLDGKCDFRMAHRYGCFEAERWNGLYIYYCPLSLSFVATVIYFSGRAEYAIVSGPLVMGSLDDIPAEGLSAGALADLPQRSPKAVNALAKTQRAISVFLSDRAAEDVEDALDAQKSLQNTLYDIAANIKGVHEPRYPLELEKKLQGMVTRGDRQGARDLINQLLGTLYFTNGGEFSEIKQCAKELVVLLSRASAEGGADPGYIFGKNGEFLNEIDSFSTLDELSVFLTSLFYRFVGYVFDFAGFEHADIMYKTVGYIRENYEKRITLEDAAAVAGISPNYLSTVFKDESGSTFTEFVNEIRVQRSRELLGNPLLTLAEIAGLVGYGDQSYFTKVFTRLTGVSPGQYRKTHGQGDLVRQD